MFVKFLFDNNILTLFLTICLWLNDTFEAAMNPCSLQGQSVWGVDLQF
jgi:hypothetical protein